MTGTSVAIDRGFKGANVFELYMCYDPKCCIEVMSHVDVMINGSFR